MKKVMMMVLLSVCAFTTQAQLSVETLGMFKHNNIRDGVSYGAGLDFGYSFNRYVLGHARVLTYEDNNWGGSVVDELGIFVEGKLFEAKLPGKSKLMFAAIGGGIRDFSSEDWGFSVGPRIRLALTDRFGILVEEQIEARIKDTKNLKSVVGLYYSF